MYFLAYRLVEFIDWFFPIFGLRPHFWNWSLPVKRRRTPYREPLRPSQSSTLVSKWVLFSYVYTEIEFLTMNQYGTTSFGLSARKSNVVPGRASALVNHRIHPAQTLDQVIEHDQSSMKDPRVRISVQSSYPPMKVSPYGPSIPQYSLIARSVKQVFPDCIIAPGWFTLLFIYNWKNVEKM